MSKYQLGGSQTEYQVGSDNRVLVNKLGITEPAEMDDAEFILLMKLYQDVLLNLVPAEMVKLNDINGWHYRWLGNIYNWAGQCRDVNMSKDGFPFAAALQIPQLFAKFERDYLAKYTPCMDLDRADLIEAIAITHVELILIHPFREGNGRLSRLLADVMAVQAGYEPLDYTEWELNKSDYIMAIHAGVNCNYEPMKHWVDKALL